jgi:hypothetical protein
MRMRMKMGMGMGIDDMYLHCGGAGFFHDK